MKALTSPVRLSLISSSLVLTALSCSGRQAPSGQVGQSSDVVGSFAQFASAKVRDAAVTYPDVALELEAPMSLTTSDGTGLEMTRLVGRAVVEGPLAFTELRLSFRNPTDRVLEGRFSITLPENAAISRLAMRIDGRWQEAEVVERQLARRAYEDFLHRRQDPALLEKEAGNQFRARIFPIPANGVKDLIVSYSHELTAADEPYRLPLHGLPEIGELDVSARVAGANGAFQSVSLARQKFVPKADFVARSKATIGGVTAGRLAAFRIAPSIDGKRESIRGMAILFDTSASRAPGFKASVAALGELVAALAKTHGNDLRLRVAAFDQETSSVFAGRAGDFGAKQLTAIMSRRPLGASNLGGALSWVGQQKDVDRLVVVTDGIATAGEADAGELRARVAAMTSIRRLDMVLSGGIRDTALARTLVRGTRDADGAVLDAADGAAVVASRLSKATVSGIAVNVPSARWVWPETLDGVQAGDEFIVYADVKDNTPSQIRVELSGGHSQRMSVALRPVEKPLLARSAAIAEIARLTARRAKRTGPESAKIREHLKQQIIEVSTKHRVLSDFTALLVLETEADYVRFGIDRKALADILTVGPQGVSLQKRTELAIAKPVTTPPPSGDGDASMPKKTAKQKEKPAYKSTGSTMDEPGDAAKVDAKPTDATVASVDAPPPPPRAPSPEPARQARRDEERRVASGRTELDDDDDDDSDAEEDSADEGEDGAGDDIDAFAEKIKNSPPAYTGRMATVMGMLEAQKVDDALVEALRWRNEEPGDVMALIALGEALELANNHRLAARAYGSIIDLFPSRADLRRFAGARLQRLRKAASLAADSFHKALEQRPDHLSVYRLLAFALVRDGDHAQAFEVLERGLARSFPSGRFAGGKRILGEDLRLVGAAWQAAQPTRANEIAQRLEKQGLKIADKPSLRFVLNWETDANDVDFHIYDAKGGHAYYSQKSLPSGGELYADVTTGYGPECFAIEGEPTAFPYKMQIHYYSRGPMGYGMGQVEIVSHDGKGNLRFQQRPFVVMNDSAYLDLGTVTREAL